MADAATPPEKKDLLISHGAHEIRNPASVILGWVRMLSSDRMGELTELQRKAVAEIDKSTARLAELAREMSFLAKLMEGGHAFVQAPVDLSALIAQVIPAVPEGLDGAVPIRLIDETPGFTLTGDAKHLADSFNSLMFAHRRELGYGAELCVAIVTTRGAVQVVIGAPDHIDWLRTLSEPDLEPLVEFRGGVGYKLSIARHVIEAHGGRIFSKTAPPPTPQASPTHRGVVVILPRS